MFLRAIRQLLSRGHHLIVSDGEEFTRVVGRGNITYATTRHGARLDVAVEPLIPSCPLNSRIHAAQALWCIRDPAFISNLPSIRWIRRVQADIDWTSIPKPPTAAPDVVSDDDFGDEVIVEDALIAPEPIAIEEMQNVPCWSNFSLSLISTTLSSGIAMIAFQSIDGGFYR